MFNLKKITFSVHRKILRELKKISLNKQNIDYFWPVLYVCIMMQTFCFQILFYFLILCYIAQYCYRDDIKL